MVAAAILTSALPLSGAARFLTGISIEAGLFLALVLAGAFLALAWPLLGTGARDLRSTAAFVVLTLVSSLLALGLLGAPRFEGFPAGTCADAGNHLYLKNTFIAVDPDVYAGMVTLYAVHHFLLALGWDDLSAFRVAWQLVVVGCMVLVSAATVAGARSLPTRGLRRALYLAAALTIAAPAYFVALPLLHYYQSDGYLAQLFSLVPLMVAVGAYAFATRRLARVVALLASIGLYRFTYLLNAGDLMLASGAMLLMEWRLAPRSRSVRLGLLAVVLACAAASVAAYAGLLGIVRIPGGFRSAPLVPQLVGLGLLSTVFTAAGPVSRHFGASCPPHHRRLASFLAVLCGAPTVLVAAWLLSGEPATYYVEKYAFCAIILGSLCVVPVVMTVVIGLVTKGRTPAAGVAASLLVLATCAGLFGLAWSADTYAPWFRERFASPPYHYLEPHADRSAWRIISSTLRREKAEFGGFLTPRWPESQFTNAHFGVTSPRTDGTTTSSTPGVWPSSRYHAIYQGATLETPGHCVFWYESERLPASLRNRWHPSARAVVERLQASGPRSCKSFKPRHAPSTRLAVCSRCFAGGGGYRALSLAGPLDGFHGVERDADGSDVRWTTGNGSIPFSLLQSESGRACSAFVQAGSGQSFEMWLDGARLGAGPRQPLPRLFSGGTHVLSIRSSTFVPATLGDSADRRVLGVRVSRVVLECSDVQPAEREPEVETGPISVVSATYGRACGAVPGNYTQSVVDECNGRFDCTYPPADRRGDPFPGCAKDFSVEYRCGNGARVRRAEHAAKDEPYNVELTCGNDPP
jgi:hypothetical protein